MFAVKYLVKLYEIPSEYGQISAFDTQSNSIFTGTDKGILLKLLVEGMLHSPPPPPPPQQQQQPPPLGDASSSGGVTDKNGNLRMSFQASYCRNSFSMEGLSDAPQRITTTLLLRTVLSTANKKVERVQHSRTHNLLFVLVDHRLLLLNSTNFSQLQTIAEHVGTFYVSDSRQNSTQRFGIHVICASEMNGKGLNVFEFDASRGEHARAVLVQELVLPEPAQVLVTHGGVACVGMRREYGLLSLSDGGSRCVLSLGRGMQPLLAVGDGEVFMRYNQSIFSVSMRSMPSDRVLGRTIQLKDEALSFVVRYPFLFVFTENYCDVCSLYDEDVFERLPLPGCLFASQLGCGDFLYAASKTKIWMAALHSLRHQLADLVSSFKVEEAFHLLDTQRTKTALDWQEIELELHIMAGFAYLHRCRSKEAMLHFNDHIDPRDLLLLLPECIPPSPEEYSIELQKLLKEGRSHREAGGSAKDGELLSKVAAMNAVGEHDEFCDANKPSHKVDVADNDDYWAQWEGCCPYNAYVGEIQNAWLETYETFPLVPRSGKESNQDSLLRHVMEWGAISVTTFLEYAWEQFKDELVLYFRSRLRQTNDVYARSMEYALLVLALEAQDHRAAYRVVAYGSSLRVEDCYDLLSSLRDYRLLACLLYRHGYILAANDLLTCRVYISSLLPPLSVKTDVVGNLLPAYRLLPKVMHARLDQLFSPVLTSQKVNARHLPAFWKRETLGTLPSLEELPPSLSEVMYLVGNLNLPALQEILRENQGASCTVDEQGCSLLHVLFSLLVIFESFEDNVSLERGNALLSLVLSCASVLLDYGAPVAVLNVHGLTCLDVAALAADGIFVDVVAATLLADDDVNNAVATRKRDNNTMGVSES